MEINLSSYIKELLEELQMQDCKLVKTPIGSKIELMIEHDEKLDDQLVNEYQETVSNINYLANNSRSDLCQVANVLCRYMSRPARAHYEPLKIQN